MFEIEIQGLKIAVSEHIVNGQQVFRLSFADNRKPLVVARAKTWNGDTYMDKHSAGPSEGGRRVWKRN